MTIDKKLEILDIDAEPLPASERTLQDLKYNAKNPPSVENEVQTVYQLMLRVVGNELPDPVDRIRSSLLDALMKLEETVKLPESRMMIGQGKAWIHKRYPR